ncbi:YbaB/EbfC family nucleoid-associated protein [Candidatus Acetothermia bacterium]|nr:YbaB/EbfC family nucleoid-associated protein [Candidatus Acetothermia bacterium]
MMKGIGNLGKLMKQAQSLQGDLIKKQAELEKLQVEANAGGGMVTAIVTGHGKLSGLRIAKEVVDPTDIEMLEDLIVAAIQEAQNKAHDISQKAMGELTQGLNLPPGFPL